MLWALKCFAAALHVVLCVVSLQDLVSSSVGPFFLCLKYTASIKRLHCGDYTNFCAEICVLDLIITHHLLQ